MNIQNNGINDPVISEMCEDDASWLADFDTAVNSEDEYAACLSPMSPMDASAELENAFRQESRFSALQVRISKVLQHTTFLDEDFRPFSQLYEHFSDKAFNTTAELFASGGPGKPSSIAHRRPCIVITPFSFRNDVPFGHDRDYSDPPLVLIAWRNHERGPKRNDLGPFDTSKIDRLVEVLDKRQPVEPTFCRELMTAEEAVRFLNAYASAAITFTYEDRSWLDTECFVGNLQIPMNNIECAFFNGIANDGFQTCPADSIDVRLKSILSYAVAAADCHVAASGATLSDAAFDLLFGPPDPVRPEDIAGAGPARIVAEVFFRRLAGED